MKHECYGNWKPGKNCRACIESEECKGSAMAPAPKKRGRPKKDEPVNEIAEDSIFDNSNEGEE